MYSITLKWLPLQILLPLFCYFLFSAAVPAQTTCNFYRLADVTSAYPPADPRQNAQVKNVGIIFEKLRKMVGDLSHWQLAVVTIPDQMRAMALQDGIVLSLKAVQVSYENVSQEVGDARMAFVLGHELAHLEGDHDWHNRFLCALKDDQPLAPLLTEYHDKNGLTKEAEADDKGFLYAARAGFAVHRLLEESPKQPDFFTYWQQRAEVAVDKDHAEPKVRADTLRSRLRDLLKKIPIFDFGVRLSHFDRCADAIYFLEEFHPNFPAPESFNNRGYCRVQIARQRLESQALPTTSMLPYCLPMMLDVRSRLHSLTLPGTVVRGALEEETIEDLKWAHELFQNATRADPHYLPAWLNLAVAAFYLEEYYEARDAIEKAKRLISQKAMRLTAASTSDLEGLQAIINYEQNRRLDSWPNAIETLEKLASQPQATPCILYNTVKLLEERQRSPTEKYWQQLVTKLSELPSYLRDVVCHKQTCPPVSSSTSKVDWKLPLVIGTPFRTDPTWEALTKEPIRTVLGEIYVSSSSPKTEILTLGGNVEMVVFKDLATETLTSLTTRCGHALQESQRVINGTVYRCDNWAALMDGERVKEVWVTK